MQGVNGTAFDSLADAIMSVNQSSGKDTRLHCSKTSDDTVHFAIAPQSQHCMFVSYAFDCALRSLLIESLLHS